MKNIRFDKKFGVELEFTRESNRHFLYSTIREVHPRDEVLITNWQKNINNKEWICKTDSSCGFEIASPVFKKKSDLDRIARLVDELRRRNAKTDRKCGIHIHIECKRLSAHMLSRIIKYWIKAEPIILCMFPKYRRINKYCRPLISKFDINRKYTPTQLIKLYSHSKNNSLNVRGYKERGTLEFRMMEGLLRSGDIINWIVFCIRFYRSALESKTPNNLDPFSMFEFWNFMQLEHVKNKKNDIHDIPSWFLRRIKKNCPLKEFKEQALELKSIYLD